MKNTLLAAIAAVSLSGCSPNTTNTNHQSDGKVAGVVDRVLQGGSPNIENTGSLNLERQTIINRCNQMLTTIFNGHHSGATDEELLGLMNYFIANIVSKQDQEWHGITINPIIQTKDGPDGDPVKSLFLQIRFPGEDLPVTLSYFLLSRNEYMRRLVYPPSPPQNGQK